MGYLSTVRKTEKIKLAEAEDFWVEVRLNLSFDEAQALNELVSNESIPTAEQNKKSLRQVITAWNLTDEGDQPMELSEENMGKLSIQHVNQIQMFIAERITANQKKELGPPSDAGEDRQ